jgi:hypothetical protein
VHEPTLEIQILTKPNGVDVAVTIHETRCTDSHRPTQVGVALGAVRSRRSRRRGTRTKLSAASA